MQQILANISQFFDRMEASWESSRGRHLVADTLIISFLLALTMIEAQRRSLLPQALAPIIPTNHFYAIDFTLQLVQIVGLVGIIFGLARSVSNTVGKQLEILSLMLLRGAFREMTAFDEPMTWSKAEPAILPILVLSTSALLMFVILRFYYRIQRHQAIADDFQNLSGFVATKKLIALGLMLAFFSIGIYTIHQYLSVGHMVSFFGDCYTALIFSDVLLVFVSMRYSSTYHVVFRNTGFALATVLIRVAVIAPEPFNGLVGIASALFAVGLTIAYNTFASTPPALAGAPTPATRSAPLATAPVAPSLNSSVLHEAEQGQLVEGRR